MARGRASVALSCYFSPKRSSRRRSPPPNCSIERSTSVDRATHWGSGAIVKRAFCTTSHDGWDPMTPANDDHRVAAWLDNDFSSQVAMERLHRPVIGLCRDLLAGRAGIVADLGAGDASLLAAICSGMDGLRPLAIERRPDRAARAHLRLEVFGGRALTVDLF